MRTDIRPREGPGPIFNSDEVWCMKRELREHFGSAAVDELPLLDLWELYLEAIREEGEE